MAPDAKNLIWIDLEMTGLNTQEDFIIEMATIITNEQLEILAEGPVLAIHQPDVVLEAMDSWNQKHHGQSGLIERVRQSNLTEAEAEQQTLDFIMQYVPESKSPMCGNSICQDRRFLSRHMPHLERYFHYRNLDVSSMKILAQRWAPKVFEGAKKTSTHVALQDIRDSIAELRYYKNYFFKIEEVEE